MGVANAGIWLSLRRIARYGGCFHDCGALNCAERVGCKAFLIDAAVHHQTSAWSPEIKSAAEQYYHLQA
jgi:hypothetical protein